MDYMTVREAVDKWGISQRRVQQLCEQGRILEVQLFGISWMIPKGAGKPVDPRREKQKPKQSLSSDLTQVIAATTAFMPRHNPDAVLETVSEERLRLQYEGELAYLRGDFKRTMRCFLKTEGDDAARLRACPVAIAAAISLGDYHAYKEINEYLNKCVKANKGSDVAAFAELALATVAVSVIAPSMSPDWLKKGEFVALLPQTRLNALYLRAKYFHCVGKNEAMLAVAQTALTLCALEQGFTMTEIYLRVTCAVACHFLEREDDAKRWLLEAMRLALPHGFITPFAEVVTALGGLVEQCLEQAFPDNYGAVIGEWKRTWKNWVLFHNQFTKNNITLILTLREYHISLLVARHVTYAKIAEQYGISVGRLKNIMMRVYGKLLISGRDELADYIF